MTQKDLTQIEELLDRKLSLLIPPARYMSSEHAAEYLDKSKRWLYNQNIPFVMVGGQRRYTDRDIADWIYRNCTMR